MDVGPFLFLSGFSAIICALLSQATALGSGKKIGLKTMARVWAGGWVFLGVIPMLIAPVTRLAGGEGGAIKTMATLYGLFLIFVLPRLLAHRLDRPPGEN